MERNLGHVTYCLILHFLFSLHRSKLETSNLVRLLSTKTTIYNYETRSKGRYLSHVTCL